MSEYLEICVLDCASMRDSCAVDKYVHVIEYGEDFFGCLEDLAVVARHVKMDHHGLLVDGLLSENIFKNIMR